MWLAGITLLFHYCLACSNSRVACSNRATEVSNEVTRADMQWAFAGPFCDRPETMVVTPELACPVIVRLHSTHDDASQEFIDVMAHDIHCAGYVLLQCLTGMRMFAADASAGSSVDAVWASVAEKQTSWVSRQTLPPP